MNKTANCIASALVFFAPYFTSQANGAEHKKQVSAQSESRQSVLEQKYGFLSGYDKLIDSSIAYFSQLGITTLTRNLVKAQIFVESGSIADRNSAFKYDPMQIANSGDFALETLVNGSENTDIIGYFSCLNGIENTPRNNGKWDYSNSKMTAEKSIYGGIGWLVHYLAKVDFKTVEEGDFLYYTIADGDSFSKISAPLGTTVGVLRKYNSVDPKKLRAGQVVKYKSAKVERYISGWRDIESGINRYNGGGNPEYLSKVMKAKKELDELDKHILLSQK